MASRKRKLESLTRADIGKQITFTCECKMPTHVTGTIRAFTHGAFSAPARGNKDEPLVLVTVRERGPMEGDIQIPGCDSSHWAAPTVLATIERTTTHDDHA